MKNLFLIVGAIFCIGSGAFAAADYELALILAPGRSGTSIYTKAVNVAGMSLTRAAREYPAASAKRSSPWGGYEDANVARVSKDIATRERQRVFKVTRTGILAGTDDLDTLIKYIKADFVVNPKIVIKNTQAAIMLPTWEAAFTAIRGTGKTLADKYVIVLRNPVDMATSVEIRKVATFADALSTWELSGNAILTGTEGKSRLFVKFEDILSPNTGATIARLAAFLGTTPDPAKVTEFETKFLDPAYVNARTPFNTVTDPRLSDTQKALVARLEALYDAQ